MLCQRCAVEQRAEIDRDKARLPVVAVDDIRLKADDRKSGQNSLVEEDKFAEILRHVRVGVAVGEELLVVYKVVDDAIHFQRLNADKLVDAGARGVHVEVTDMLHLTLVLILNACILRHDDSDVHTHFGEGFRQCAHDVPEATSLGERVTF